MFTNQETRKSELRATVEISGAMLFPLNPMKFPKTSVYFEDGKVIPGESWDKLRELIKTAHDAASGMFHFTDHDRDGWDAEQYKALMKIVDDALSPLLFAVQEAAELMDAADDDPGVYNAATRLFER